MRVGLISGSGAYSWPALGEANSDTVETRYGSVPITRGSIGAVEVVHLARHGAGHARLAHQVQHRANLAALLACQVDALISLTVCGSLHARSAPGSLLVFDDLYFPDNRLPDGTPCTWHDQPGEPGRGHWIFDRPFCEPLRQHALAAAADGRVSALDGGCYGHVAGPRFNSRSEIRALTAAGVTAISQTAGPEVVLAGEAELPMLLLGYVTDYANGVTADPQPVEELRRHLTASVDVFARMVNALLARISEHLPAAGVMYRVGA